MATTKFNINLYNPAQKEKETLKKEFVVRTKIFDMIFHDLKSSKMEHSEQAYLLVGQRGSGKTTLLQRLRYAVEDDKQLNKFLIPIVFTEEQYNINELTDIWETIAGVLEDYHGFQGLTKSISGVIAGNEDYEVKVFNLLIDALNKRGEKVIIFIDNIGDLFRKLDNLEIKRFREVLTTTAQMRVIGANTSLSEHIFDYREPFHEFFNVILLNDLSGDEVKTLLNKIAVLNHAEDLIKNIIENEPHRIDILRQLTGGVPRTIIMMFNVFMDNVEGKSVRDLELMLDNVTPLYKARLDDLAPQQQKIIDAVAKNWDSISVKELVGKTRLESKAISSQLNQLVRDNFIETVESENKNKVYRIKERFLNIWYLMRYGRKRDQSRVIWLVKFMEALLGKEELQKKAKYHIDQLQKGDFDIESASLMCEALIASSQIDNEIKWDLIQASRKTLPIDFTKDIKLNWDEYSLLATNALVKGKIEEAESIINEIPEDSFRRPLLIACLHCAKKEFVAFEKITTTLINDKTAGDVDKLLLYMMMGHYYGYVKKDYKIAVEYLNQANTIHEMQQNYEALVLFYAHLNDIDGATLSCQKFESLGGDTHKAKVLRILVNMFADAHKVLDKNSELYNNYEQMLRNIFTYLLSQEEYEKLGTEFPYLINALAKLRFKKDKEGAYENYLKAKKYFDDKPSIFESRILLWNDYYEESVDSVRRYMDFIKDSKDIKNQYLDTSAYLVLLIAKGYTNAAYKLFTDFPILKDVIKPTWFALLTSMGDEYKSDILKMAPELKEPVEQVLKQIEQAKVDYA